MLIAANSQGTIKVSCSPYLPVKVSSVLDCNGLQL